MATKNQITKQLQKDVKLSIRHVLSSKNIDAAVENIVNNNKNILEEENLIPVAKDIVCALGRELEFQYSCKKGMQGYSKSRKNIEKYYGNL
jgi:hypothetical protein